MTQFLKRLLYSGPLGTMLEPQYRYGVSPKQLLILMQSIQDTEGVPGHAVEIGVGQGYTSITLCALLKELKSDRRYYCVDTFAGFTSDDLKVERSKYQGQKRDEEAFRYQSQERFDKMLARRAGGRASTIRADITQHQWPDDWLMSFCFVDVDLYQPMKIGLQRAWERMSPGGILLAHDVIENASWRGSWDAYHEFCAENGIEPKIPTRGLGFAKKG